ncbi:MAG: class I SAM-dependent RNA methyltransferase [Actinomycetaceae bacterium]
MTPEPVDAPVTVGAPAHGGFTVARVGDVVTFVRHAAPGESVRLAVTAKRSKVWFADAVEVLDPSADRVPHVWPEAGPGGIGGAELGHLRPAAQRDWKSDVLAESLRRIGGERIAADAEAAAGSLRVLPVGPGTEGGTRTRIDLTVTADGRPGMHRYRSDVVLPVTALPLADPRLPVEEILALDSLRPGARLRAVVGSGPSPDGVARLLVDGRAVPGSPVTSGRVAERVETMFGPLDHALDDAGFWQVHTSAPAALVESVLALAAGIDPDPAALAGEGGDPDRAGRVTASLAGSAVVELYSGAGLLTKAIGEAVGQGGAVLSLEGDVDAVRSAADAIDHASVRTLAGAVTGRSVAALGEEDDWRPGGVVVLDPPRSGARDEVVSAVAALAPRRIVHVACDPAALARDLASAAEAGYVVERIVALDLFPHTHHLEVVAALVPA